jgi:hypothetical protein
MLPSEDECIAQWGQMSRSALAELEPDDGFEKRHLLNPAVLRILGDVAGQRASGSLAHDPSRARRVKFGPQSCALLQRIQVLLDVKAVVPFLVEDAQQALPVAPRPTLEEPSGLIDRSASRGLRSRNASRPEFS